MQRMRLWVGSSGEREREREREGDLCCLVDLDDLSIECGILLFLFFDCYDGRMQIGCFILFLIGYNICYNICFLYS